MADDWEKEYEEDRRRMLAGQQISVPVPRAPVPQVLAPVVHPVTAPSRHGYEPPSIPSSQDPFDAHEAKTKKDAEEAEIERFYANQFAEEESKKRVAAATGATVASFGGGSSVTNDSSAQAAYYNARAYPQPDDPIDSRYHLPFVTLPSCHADLFGEKTGKFLYFAESVEVFFKGFWSPNAEPMLLFVTPLCAYFGDVKTGEILLARTIESMTDLIQLGDSGLAICCRQESDVICTISTSVALLIDVLRKLHAAYESTVRVRSLEGKNEKSYRKGVSYMERGATGWDVIEDPRSGLPLVDIPEKQIPYYAPLVPKILHWFGGVNHIQKDWKGSMLRERRGCWLTATCLFLSLPNGPQSDGRDIRRCVAFEFISVVVNGTGGHLGILVASGPKQPPLALCFDSLDIKENIIHILRCCFEFRTKRALVVKQASNFDREVAVEKEAHLKPELYLMKTRLDLYELLRSPTIVKKRR